MRTRYINPLLLITVLAISIGMLGVGYAAWSRSLSVSGLFGTGSLSVIFDQGRAYSVTIVDAKGNPVGEGARGNQIQYSLSEDKKQVDLTVSQALLADALIPAGRMLKLEYPLGLGDESTLRAVNLYQARPDEASPESVEFKALDAVLCVEGQDYLLPDYLNSFCQPLSFEVYRQVSMEYDHLIGTMYLRLSEESRKQLKEPAVAAIEAERLPPELLPLVGASEGDESGFLEAQLKVNYSFLMPLYVGQAEAQITR